MNRIRVDYLRYFLVGLLAFAGVAHIVAPDPFLLMMPGFIPSPRFWVLVSGLVELALAAGLIYAPSRKWSALLVLAMFVVYLPVHVIDLLRDEPAIGSKLAAVIRIPMQFLLFWVVWKVFRKES